MAREQGPWSAAVSREGAKKSNDLRFVSFPNMLRPAESALSVGVSDLSCSGVLHCDSGF